LIGFLQVQRHWVAHDAGADKSDFSHEKILLFLLLLQANGNALFVGASLLAMKVPRSNDQAHNP
jgi:hypothetical protein